MAGSIFTGDVIKSQLEDANRNYYGQRTWAEMFGNLDLSKQLGTENLIQNYGAIVGEAYKASKANQSAILGSNIGQGYKNAMLEENRLALDKAYDSYMSQYLTEQAQLNQSVETQRQAINKELDTLAQRTADYGNAHFDYLQALWDKHEAGELNFNPFAQANFAKYLNNTYDDNGNILSSNIKSIGEMEGIVFDGNGNLTQAGIDFFDMLEHDDVLSNYSFSDYLRENDKELYNWATSENQYDFAPNAAGLNIKDGMFRRMVGQSSLDEQYSFLERAYGLNDGEIKTLFSGLENKANELIESLQSFKNDTSFELDLTNTYELDNEKINESTKSFIDELDKLVSDLGLSKEFDRIVSEAGYDNLESYIRRSILDYTLDVNEGVEENYNEVYNEIVDEKQNENYENFIGKLSTSQDYLRDPLGSFMVDTLEVLRLTENQLIAEWTSFDDAEKVYQNERYKYQRNLGRQRMELERTLNNILSGLVNYSTSLND